MKNAALLFPDVLQAMLAVDKATSGVDFVTRVARSRHSAATDVWG
jgi:hypothetical protein